MGVFPTQAAWGLGGPHLPRPDCLESIQKAGFGLEGRVKKRKGKKPQTSPKADFIKLRKPRGGDQSWTRGL